MNSKRCKIVLMVVFWRYRMPFNAKGSISTLMNVDSIKWMYFCINEFEVGVNDIIFSGDKQQNFYDNAIAYLGLNFFPRKQFPVV